MRIGGPLAAVALGLVLAGLSHPAFAQSVDAVRQVIDLVATNRDEMSDAAGRLRPLVLAGTAKESEPIQTLLIAVMALDSRADSLSLVGSVLVEMKSPEDLTVARAAFRRAARRMLETANDQLDFIQESLKRITSRDALAQAIIIQDAVKAIRDAVRPHTARE